MMFAATSFYSQIIFKSGRICCNRSLPPAWATAEPTERCEVSSGLFHAAPAFVREAAVSAAERCKKRNDTFVSLICICI